jgi:hypothetical protein
MVSCSEQGDLLDSYRRIFSYGLNESGRRVSRRSSARA